MPLSSTLTDSTWPPWMSNFRESLNHSMGIKNAPCLLTFAGSWLLYLAYMGHSVSFIPCQMCVRIDVLNFWERSGLVCVLWRNCLLFCVMRCRELRVFLRSAEFLFKTQHWIPSDCREVGIIWQKWARQFPCAGKGGSKDKGWDDCGQGWAGGRFISCPRASCPQQNPSLAAPAALSLHPSVLLTPGSQGIAGSEGWRLEWRK